MVGLDVGSYGIKVVEVVKKSGEFQLLKIASAYNPVGHFLPSDEKQLEVLISAAKTLLLEQKLIGKKVAISIPESFVYSSIVEMPWLSDAELSSAIQWEAEQHLPVALDTVNLEYTVINRSEESGEKKMKVLLVAAKKDIVERLITATEYMEIDLMVVEPASLALGRVAVIDQAAEGSSMVCNFGALTTDLIILSGMQPAFMHSIPTGGLAMTRAVERGLGMKPSQAEEYKRTYGMSTAQLEGKVASTLIPVFNSILAEIRKSIQFFQSKNGGVINKILLSGGGAYLPDLAIYITEKLGNEAQVLNPFGKIQLDSGLRLPKEAASFGVAVGLSLREDE